MAVGTLRHFEKTYFVFLTLTFIGLGFLGNQYYLAHQEQFAPPKYSTAEIRRVRGLFKKLHKAEFKNAALESDVAELNLSLANAYSGNDFLALQRVTQMVGMLPQEGPGLEVIVKDSEKPLLLGDNPNTGIVHNTDLLSLVNELRVAGALAISINDQPVSNATAITCAGPIISVNGTRIASPFVIAALGNPDAMLQKLNASDGFVKELSDYGIDVTINPKQHLVVQPYSTD